MQLLFGDLSRVTADAIVISANPEPICGEGVDEAIFNAAGQKQLNSVRKNIGRISVGQAVYTRAFSLQAKYIIHTVSPMWRGGSNKERELLGECFYNCLKLAEQLGCKSIAFPLIGTKSGRIPGKEAIQIALGVFEQYPSRELDIRLVLYDEKFVETAKALYPDIEILNLEDEIRRSGHPVTEDDTSAIWEPEEEILFCEKKNIRKYQALKGLEETARKVGDNGRRSEAQSLDIPYIMASEEIDRDWEEIGAHPEEMPYFVLFLLGISSLFPMLLPLIGLIYGYDRDSWIFIMAPICIFFILLIICLVFDSVSRTLKKGNKRKRARAELISIKNSNTAMSQIVYRELKIGRHPFENPNTYNFRVCVNYLSELSGDSNEKIINSFQDSLIAGLKELAIRQLGIMKKSQETELQYCGRCISSLRQLYGYEDDDVFLLVAAYLKRPDLCKKVKQADMESQSIHFSSDWEQLSERYKREIKKGVFETEGEFSARRDSEKKLEYKRLERVFYELIVKYIQLRANSISSEPEMIRSDYYKVRNYILDNRTDWLYRMTPPAFLGIPYEVLYTQYKQIFSVIQLKFYAMLESAGMLEDFQNFYDLNIRNHDVYIGRLLFHIIYYLQCERNASRWEKKPLDKVLQEYFR